MSKPPKRKNNSTKTNSVMDIQVICQDIGDKLYDRHLLNGDLKSAQLSIQAYNTALKAVMSQLIYKKLTGYPGKIPFYEEDSHKPVNKLIKIS